jgi:hypothetical protein
MYICVNVYMNVYIYMCVYMHVFMYVFMYLCMCVGIKPGGWQLTCVTRNSWERKPRGVKTTESEFSHPIPLPQQILYSYS